MYNFKEKFPNYSVTKTGKIYKNDVEMKPFKSNKYLQVVLFDSDNKKHVYGVHTVVAMFYLSDYEPGCIVHHKDGNIHNNSLENLQVLTRKQHTSLHNKGNRRLAEYVKKHGPANKGRKMSKDFCQKCSDSAKTRGFNGNQFVDKFGNKR